MNPERRVLLSTLPFHYGKGVAAHTRYVLRALARAGLSVTVAYHQPYSMTAELSVPSWRLGRRKPSARTATVEGVGVREVGCWLPELEFTHYWPSQEWRELIDSHDLLLAVTGNALAATPFAMSGRPFLAWLGTPFAPDRSDRVRQFRGARKLLDRVVNSPMCELLERKTLNAGLIVPTTRYVARELRAIAPKARILDPIPIPVDTDFFAPGGQVSERTITFVGKYNDPRKNIHFLLEVFRACLDRGARATLRLYGDTPSAAVRAQIQRLSLERDVEGLRKVSREELRSLYRSSTVFVIPSFQEGLCVAGLEALACGCPVVTSGCGGPEDFVADGVNGRVVPREKEAFTEAILRILESGEERSRMSDAALATVQSRFTVDAVDPAFGGAFRLLEQAEQRAGDKGASARLAAVRGEGR